MLDRLLRKGTNFTGEIWSVDYQLKASEEAERNRAWLAEREEVREDDYLSLARTRLCFAKGDGLDLVIKRGLYQDG